MELMLAARRSITKAQLRKWAKASKAEKSAILDAVCEVTGWHRDHARKAIRAALADQGRGGPAPRRPRDPVRVYGEERMELLDRLGHASSKAEEGGREARSRPGWEKLPSAASADAPLP
jgi:hypothetical protein